MPELGDAVNHFFGAGPVTATDWQVLLYTAGRAMLWVVVLSSCISMYEYFRGFYLAAIGRGAARREAAEAAAADNAAAATAPPATTLAHRGQ